MKAIFDVGRGEGDLAGEGIIAGALDEEGLEARSVRALPGF